MAELNPLEALLGATTEVKEQVYMKRLKTHFTIKALTGDRINDLRAQCTYPVGKGANRRMEVREDELAQLFIAEACVEPDFNNPELLKHYGAPDAATCVQKALLAGEVARLSSAVLDVSGFDLGEEDVEEAKN